MIILLEGVGSLDVEVEAYPLVMVGESELTLDLTPDHYEIADLLVLLGEGDLQAQAGLIANLVPSRVYEVEGAMEGEGGLEVVEVLLQYLFNPVLIEPLLAGEGELVAELNVAQGVNPPVVLCAQGILSLTPDGLVSTETKPSTCPAPIP